MNQIEVRITSKHLKNNSYVNCYWDKNQLRYRRCPLWEALSEIASVVRVLAVGYCYALVYMNDNYVRKYNIPSYWNEESVENLVKRANNEENIEVTVLLTLIKGSEI